MRLDAFLAVSRVVKRRTLANQLCQAGGVLTEGKALKASWPVVEGAVITVDYGNRSVVFRVECLPPPGKRSFPDAVTVLERRREPIVP